jgi:branched-chain amino acid aminotransferase
LPGITRDSVIQICNELGLTVKERSIQRAALYVADEIFFSGTAAEITPIRSVDRITIGNGTRGEITEKIQKVFFEITSGERPAPGEWLTYVHEDAKVGNNGFKKETKVGTSSTIVEPATKLHAAGIK